MFLVKNNGMKLQLLFESDFELRDLERRAAQGDPAATDRLIRLRNRHGLSHELLRPVKAFRIEFPNNIGDIVERRYFGFIYSRHFAISLLSNYLDSFRSQDFQAFEVNNVGGGIGACVVDRRGQLPSEGFQVTYDSEHFSGPFVVDFVPVQAWLLNIWHFGSVDDATEHYGRLYHGTQSRIAYRRLERREIGLSHQNPSDWPQGRTGFPMKSNRAALRWVQGQGQFVNNITAVGSLQGPELPVNRMFLFVSG